MAFVGAVWLSPRTAARPDQPPKSTKQSLVGASTDTIRSSAASFCPRLANLSRALVVLAKYLQYAVLSNTINKRAFNAAVPRAVSGTLRLADTCSNFCSASSTYAGRADAWRSHRRAARSSRRQRRFTVSFREGSAICCFNVASLATTLRRFPSFIVR
jgi:hypothetical protein